jgi:hypothetical protein
MWTLMLPLLAGVVAQTETLPPAIPVLPTPGILRLNEVPVAAAQTERLVSFDPAQVDLRWSDNHWQLDAGGRVLKDFGRFEGDAREAMRLVRSLNLTQYGEIGTPRPVMEYWLSEGRAPSGSVPGFRPMPFNNAALKVELTQGQWCVRDGSRVLFNFGSHEDEAHAAIDVIRHHGFNRVGHVGRGAPTMLVFLAAQDAAAPSAFERPDTPAPTRVPSAHPVGEMKQETKTVEPGITAPAGLGKVTHSPGTNPITPDALPYGRQLAVTGSAAGDNGPSADRVPFEWRQLQVRREGREWKLVSGAYTLANFGANERDARLAQAVGQFYRLSEQCLIGQPNPAFTYFLAAGQSPRGMMVGVEKVPFRTEELVVRHDATGWNVGDTGQVLFQFGNNETAARQALRDIQFYRFDMVCRIGHDDAHRMNVLVRAR